MKRILCAGALLALTAMTSACGFKVFEDIGSDPHPPTVEVTSLAIYVAPVETTTTTTTTTTTDTSSKHARTITWDSKGFSLAAGEKFLIGRRYTDAGGDIVKFHLRDRDGPTQTDLSPTDQTYYSGTSGEVIGPKDGQELTGIAGPHRVELWAEDSHGSRSEKVEFVITLVI